jgi:glycosyltransferase involved in cell wall biosynthesis
MKIVHISTSAKGGAGISAFRIHNALLKNGIDSHFICLDKNSGNGHTSGPPLRKQKVKKSRLINRLIEKIKWRLEHHFNIKIISKREFLTKELKRLSPKFNCEIATLPFSDYNILEDPFVKNADIIHLHWVAGLLDYPSFFKSINKPIVWTLHDMNPFQGLFHYKEDEMRNKEIASSMDKRIMEIKRRCIKNKKTQLSIVAPSQWLLNSAMKSKVFKNVYGYRISYAVNMQIFSPKSNCSFKQSLKIPKEHIIFLFVAETTRNYRKGLDLLLEALKNLKQENITLLVIGNPDNLEIRDLNVIVLGTIEEEQALAEYYSIADAFILPSREDNLPNVMLEAMACGTPVISFNVGGMAEIITDGFNGLKANSTERGELTNVLEEFIKSKNNFSTEAIRKFALENSDPKIIAEKYRDVYKTLLKRQ